MNDNKLHIERHLAYGGLTSFIVEGLSPDEMNSILDAQTISAQKSRLCELLNEHDNDYQPGSSLGTCWCYGCGVYGIRHFGGHLIVDVGNSCD